MRLLICLALFFSTGIEAARLNWMTNFSESLEASKLEKKPLLLFFTGSDWSGWGMKIKKEVFDSEDFADQIATTFICVMIDFPHYKTLPKTEQVQNEMLKKTFDISEFPRIVILNSYGNEIARFSYFEESHDKFAAELKHIVDQDNELSSIMVRLSKQAKQFSSADLEKYYKLALELKRELDANSLLEIGLKSQDPLFFLLEKYRLLVEGGKRNEEQTAKILEELLKLDPNNEKKVHFSVAIIDFQDLSEGHVRDPKVVIAPLEDYLQRFSAQDKENIWRIEMMIAQFYLDYDQRGIALKHAESAYKAAPEQMKGEIEHSLHYIREEMAKSEVARR